MDVIFKCPQCEQELSVDSTGAGSEIQCPSCGESIVIPPPDPQAAPAAPPPPPAGPINAMATSAAAKEEKHFAVPIHDKPTENLIGKPLQPLEAAAKGAIRLRVKTIRHSDCVEVGKDHFDEMVTAFLEKTGEANVVTVSTFNYTHQDLGTRAWVTDYGAFIVYRG